MFFAPLSVLGGSFTGFQSKYSFDAGLASNPVWMEALPDDVPISSLSIPGTHDTMSYSIPSDYFRCQNWNLTMQLSSGLRYFDIRARLRDNELHIYHGQVDTGFSFTDVLVTMAEFLDSHPSEAIIMRVKQEGKPVGRANTISFEKAFSRHGSTHTPAFRTFADYFYTYTDETALPTLGHMRSKILIIQQFPHENKPYGIQWRGKRIVLEDHWITPSIYHLAEKWSAIRDAIEVAATAEHDNSVLFLTHVSTAVGVRPIEAAAGPLDRAVTGMNDMTGQWIEDLEFNPDATRTGILVMDFPGQRLIDAILRWNKPLVRRSKPDEGQWCPAVTQFLVQEVPICSTGNRGSG
ncbi:hypothetical protein ACJZ2D_004800 [Fusarium nematophilum]